VESQAQAYIEEQERRQARANTILTFAIPLYYCAGAGAFLGAILGGVVSKRLKINSVLFYR
jgi:hypothetical protein